MLLKAAELAQWIRGDAGEERRLTVVPRPNLTRLETAGVASIDLRLGRWFRTMRQSRVSKLTSVENEDQAKHKVDQTGITKEHYVRFGDEFVLHPNKFLLGITLEWIGLPNCLAGYVTGKSSLGRLGLIIETAAGIHPGFTGCLTLELTNVGEVPISLVPGMQICQVFLHEVKPSGGRATSRFLGRRKSTVGKPITDSVVDQLRASDSIAST